MRSRISVIAKSLSTVGLLIGVLFFAASLTPSLMPRTYIVQGILSGGCAAFGYGIGFFLQWLWSYLQLPPPPASVRRILLSAAILFCVVVTVVFLWRAAAWQNSIRELWGMERVETAIRSSSAPSRSSSVPFFFRSPISSREPSASCRDGWTAMSRSAFRGLSVLCWR